MERIPSLLGVLVEEDFCEVDVLGDLAVVAACRDVRVVSLDI
jgi:hypothetical protein